MGDIIVKLKDRLSFDLLYANETNLKDFSVKDLEVEIDVTTIYINELLFFDARGLPYEARNKCRGLGYKKIITATGII